MVLYDRVDVLGILELGIVPEARQPRQLGSGPQLEHRLEHRLGADRIGSRPGQLQATRPIPQSPMPALGQRGRYPLVVVVE